MEHSAINDRSEAAGESVTSRGSYVDGIFQPFPHGHPTDVVAAAGIGSRLDIHAGVPVGAAEIDRLHIVIGHAFTAIIKIFGLNCPRKRTS